MLYQPSPEQPPRFAKEAFEVTQVTSIDQLRVGYAYACIGSALELIEQTVDLPKDKFGNDSIISTHGDVRMWSAQSIPEDHHVENASLTLVYQSYHDEALKKDTLAQLWVAQPRLIGRDRGYLFTRGDEGRPQAHYFSESRGWAAPSIRSLKKLLHRRLVPAQQDQSYVQGSSLMREDDLELYRLAMERFDDASRGED